MACLDGRLIGSFVRWLVDEKQGYRRGTCCEGIVVCCFEFRCFLCLLCRRILRAKMCSDGDIVCTVTFVLTGFGIRYSMPGLYVRRFVLTATLFALLFSYWLYLLLHSGC